MDDNKPKRVVGMPFKKKHDFKLTNVAAGISPETQRKLTLYCVRNNITRAAAIRQILNQFLEGETK